MLQMRVRVLFFGMLKDLVGLSSTESEFAEGANVRTVFDAFAASHPRLSELASSIVIARNQEFAAPSTPLSDGDEIAFLPPVSGGCFPDPELLVDGHYFALTRHPIQTNRLAARIMDGSEGAVVTFEGTVRNNTNGRATLCLDYEGYESMALRVMAQIGQEIASSFAIGHVAMVHRLGRILVGEPSVVIVVTAPHRRAAFEAALEAINRLKRTVPIWKKEYFVDGEVWVEGEWDKNVQAAD